MIDIGVAGVVGADRLADGDELYDGGFSPGVDLRGDVYGPANYLAYAPFEQLFGWEGAWDDVPAAHAAAIGFDLACVAGLVLLGRRLRAGSEGRALGWALGFAWVACPWTLYTLNANANDALVAALGIGALLALRSPPGARRPGRARRGGEVRLGGAGAAVRHRRRRAALGEARLSSRSPSRSSRPRSRSRSCPTAVCASSMTAPSATRRPAARRSASGARRRRSTSFSRWPAQRRSRSRSGSRSIHGSKTPAQIAALAAAVTIAVQLTATHWFYFYVVWFLPFVLVASFAAHLRIEGSDAGRRP